MASVTPARIMEVGMAFWPAKVLLSAVELGVFTALGEGRDDRRRAPEGARPASAGESRLLRYAGGAQVSGARRRWPRRPLSQHAGDGARSSTKSPRYMGGFLEMANARLYPFWGDLTDGAADRQGAERDEAQRRLDVRRAVSASRNGSSSSWSAMSGISAGNFQAFAESSTSHATRPLCDIGGATGQLSMLVAREHPAHALRLCGPAGGNRIAARRDRGRGLSAIGSRRSRSTFSPTRCPKADVITMGMILHDWNLEKKMHLIRAAYDALPPGGAFVAIENLIDDARRENAFGLMMSLNMLIEFGDAFDFTGADFTGWCTEAGFRRTKSSTWRVRRARRSRTSSAQRGAGGGSRVATRLGLRLRSAAAGIRAAAPAATSRRSGRRLVDPQVADRPRGRVGRRVRLRDAHELRLRRRERDRGSRTAALSDRHRLAPGLAVHGHFHRVAARVPDDRRRLRQRRLRLFPCREPVPRQPTRTAARSLTRAGTARRSATCRASAARPSSSRGASLHRQQFPCRGSRSPSTCGFPLAGLTAETAVEWSHVVRVERVLETFAEKFGSLPCLQVSYWRAAGQRSYQLLPTGSITRPHVDVSNGSARRSPSVASSVRTYWPAARS